MIQSIKLLLIVFASCIMTDSYAQKVVVDGAGRVIVDASAIPHTTVPKARRTDATASSAGTNTLGNLSSKVSDEKVFQKFEVRKYDSTHELSWSNALTYCHDLLEDGGGWRLPTGRELSLMYLLRYELLRDANFILNNSHWSATEYDWKFAYALSNISHSGHFLKDSHSAYARCIRDITP